MGQRAADELMDVLESGACVDDWIADQLVIFMALAAGESEVMVREPTLHTRTAIEVAQQLTQARFTCEKPTGDGGLRTLRCKGAGFSWDE